MTEADGPLNASEMDLVTRSGITKDNRESVSFMTGYEWLFGFGCLILGGVIGSFLTFHKMDDPYNKPRIGYTNLKAPHVEQPYIRVSYLGDNKFFFGFIVEESKNISKDGDHRLKLIAMRVMEVEKKTGLKAISTQAVHVESGGAQLLSGAIVDFKNPSQ